ncbi:hypothetical protein ACOMHN_060822 [Nucella lapillus]
MGVVVLLCVLCLAKEATLQGTILAQDQTALSKKPPSKEQSYHKIKRPCQRSHPPRNNLTTRSNGLAKEATLQGTILPQDQTALPKKPPSKEQSYHKIKRPCQEATLQGTTVPQDQTALPKKPPSKEQSYHKIKRPCQRSHPPRNNRTTRSNGLAKEATLQGTIVPQDQTALSKKPPSKEQSYHKIKRPCQRSHPPRNNLTTRSNGLAKEATLQGTILPQDQTALPKKPPSKEQSYHKIKRPCQEATLQGTIVPQDQTALPKKPPSKEQSYHKIKRPCQRSHPPRNNRTTRSNGLAKEATLQGTIVPQDQTALSKKPPSKEQPYHKIKRPCQRSHPLRNNRTTRSNGLAKEATLQGTTVPQDQTALPKKPPSKEQSYHKIKRPCQEATLQGTTVPQDQTALPKKPPSKEQSYHKIKRPCQRSHLPRNNRTTRSNGLAKEATLQGTTVPQDQTALPKKPPSKEQPYHKIKRPCQRSHPPRNNLTTRSNGLVKKPPSKEQPYHKIKRPCQRSHPPRNNRTTRSNGLAKEATL